MFSGEVLYNWVLMGTDWMVWIVSDEHIALLGLTEAFVSTVFVQVYLTNSIIIPNLEKDPKCIKQ